MEYQFLLWSFCCPRFKKAPLATKKLLISQLGRKHIHSGCDQTGHLNWPWSGLWLLMWGLSKCPHLASGPRIVSVRKGTSQSPNLPIGVAQDYCSSHLEGWSEQTGSASPQKRPLAVIPTCTLPVCSFSGCHQNALAMTMELHLVWSNMSCSLIPIHPLSTTFFLFLSFKSGLDGFPLFS